MLKNTTANMPIGHIDRTSTLFHRTRDENSRICAVTAEITRKLCVYDDLAVIGRGRRVHEMQHAVAPAQRKANMCSGIEPPAIARSDPDDVATLQLRFDFWDPTFRNLVERSRRYLRFHSSERTEQRAIGSQVTIMPPALRHLTSRVRHTHAAELPGKIDNEAAVIIVVKPIFQIM